MQVPVGGHELFVAGRRTCIFDSKYCLECVQFPLRGVMVNVAKSVGVVFFGFIAASALQAAVNFMALVRFKEFLEIACFVGVFFPLFLYSGRNTFSSGISLKCTVVLTLALILSATGALHFFGAGPVPIVCCVIALVVTVWVGSKWKHVTL